MPDGSFFRLLRWLGPWAGQQLPPGVVRQTWVVRDGAPSGRRANGVRPRRGRGERGRLEAYVYRPTRPVAGTYLVAPGLHFDGPDDPRLDRFCRVLAAAGFCVVTPFLPSYVDLIVEPSAPDDLEVVARALLERLPADERITLFSISFGSWPALEVAARLGPAARAVITFGGYAEFESAIRFCVDGIMRHPDGDVRLARDPLNQPALFLNMLPWLEDVTGDTTDLEAAWREMVYRTWGRMELKVPGRREPFARELAPRVPAEQRELFLIGTGVVPGAESLLGRALDRAGDALRFADPAPAIPRLQCPAVVCHGRDDDVIPWGEAEKLYRALSAHVPARLLLTGLYGHTGAGRPSVRALGREVRAMLDIAETLARAGSVL